MSKIRGFEEVTKEKCQNYRDVNVEQLGNHRFYADIKLPVRATAHSAGYDFFMPVDTMLLPGKKTIIWSDVKAYMQEDEVLELHIRSSLGVKQGIILSNITGIVDSDYYGNKGNDGNIGFALLNTSGVGVQIKKGERICQGIFQKYYITDDDKTLSEQRVGGVGSTNE
jgi:dUTP pyrophosphatase